MAYGGGDVNKQQEVRQGQSRVVCSSGSKARERERGRELSLGWPYNRAGRASHHGLVRNPLGAVGPSTFRIFDAFPNEAGRQTHLSGWLAAAPTTKSAELFL